MTEVNPFQPLDVGGAVAYAQGAVPNLLAQQEMDLRRKSFDLALQKQNKTDNLRQQYLTELAELQRDPSPPKVAAFMGRWPEHASEIKSAYDLTKSANREGDMTRMAGIHQAFTSGHYDTVLKYLDERAAADAAAQLPEDMISKGIADAIRSGDKAKIADAQGALEQMMYGAMGGEEYIKRIAENSKPTAFEKDLNLITRRGGEGLGQARLERESYGDPSIIYEYGQPRRVFPGQLLPSSAGGGPPPTGTTGGGNTPPAPAPTATGGRYTGGWTPRERNGGDNSDEVVDNKLQALQVYTNTPIDQPLNGNQLGTVFDGIAKTEKGVGAQPGVNNPGNIIDGKWAKGQPGYAGSVSGYAKFKTPEAGRAAGLKLLGQKFLKGQNTIRSIIEGVPEKGGGGKTTGKDIKTLPDGRRFIKKGDGWYEVTG